MEPLLLAILAAAAVALAAQRARRHRPGRQKSLAPQRRPYPGDFRGKVALTYSPKPDGRPDPGEIVWTWVPFEEDHDRGKDRPVLIVARDGQWLLGLQLTSRDHRLDAAQEARHGRSWVDIGSGSWDRQRRPSAVRLDRIVRIDPDTVRREGAILDRRRFDAVAHSLSDVHHW